MKVLLDTNVLVAAFATRGLCRDVLQITLADHQLVLGQANLDELERILREKLGMSSDAVQEVVGFVREHAEVVAPRAPASWPESDPDDRWIVAAALAGSADLVVTGDRDFVNESRQGTLRVMTPRAFWELLQNGHTTRSSG